MKKLLLILLLAIVPFAAFAEEQTGYQNLVTNGNFEGDDLSCFWSYDWLDGDIYRGLPRVIEDPTNSSNHCAIVSSRDQYAGDSWIFQFFITVTDNVIEVGDRLRLTMRVRADKNAECETQAHDMPGDYNYWSMFGNISFTNDWQTIEKEVVITSDQVYGSEQTAETSSKQMHTVAFNLYVLKEANNYYFDDIKLELKKAEPSSSGWFNLIRNGIYSKDKIEFENGTFTTFTGRDGTGGGDRPARIENDPTDGQPALVVRSLGASRIDDDQAYYIADNGEEVVLNDWQSQFFISSRHVFHANEKIKLSFEARADVPAGINTEFHKGPGDYLSWGIFGSIQLQDQWKKYQFEKNITDSEDGGSTITFDLNVFKEAANTYYFRNIELCIDEASATALDHVIGSEKVFLPVPLSNSEESLTIAIDFSECLEALETNSLTELFSGNNMRVQSSIGKVSQESYSASSANIIVNDEGNSTSNGVVSFHLEKEGTGNNVNFVISNPSGNYEGKTVNTHIYFEKDGWNYEYSITFVDRENYRLDTYRTIGYEDIFLPVPEPENADGIRASIDFTNCLQTFDSDEFMELISGEHMKVQESNGMLSKQAVSATLTGASFNDDGFSDAYGTIKFHIDGNSEKKQTTFIINNTGGSFIGKNVKTRICFDNNGKYYVYNITFVDEPTYRKLTSVKSFELNVTDEIGNPITEGITILWYNAKGENIGTGSSLYSIKEETDVYYSVILDENLGRKYREVIKQKVVSEQETVTCKLNRIEEISLHGKVSAYGTALYRAEVYLTQWLNGKYEYTASTLTDANGEFTLNAYNDSTELIVLANGYIDNKIVRRHLNNGGELGTIDMMEVQGKVVALNLSYQEATKEGVEPIIHNWYSDTRNIGYNVQNLTKGTEITDYAIQQGNIVLPTGTDRGDRIQITVSSLNEKFTEVTAEGIIADNDTANVDIMLLAFGGIEAVYGQKADDNLLAMLYDSTGKLQMRTVCSSSRLTFTNLAAGTYSLVTMGYNGAIGSVADLSDLAGMDLSEGTDYVLSSATVRDGYIASVNVASVPELDASKFEYTGENTSFMPNKTQLVISNFITLTARVDFKKQYAEATDNVKIIVDIPEGCEFISNSVVIGNKPIPHSLNGNRLTISVDKEDIDKRIRFCMFPTRGGTFLTTAYAEFDYKGTKTQPIGQIRFEATTGELFVPSTTKTSSIIVAGIGVPKADVEVYDNDAMIGTTKSLGNGKWSLKCELNNAYNLSTHDIFVKYRGEGNVVGLTESKECFYDINAIVPKTVTMVNTAHPAGNLTPKVYKTVFNYETILAVQNYYLYWPNYPDFTFLIDLSENDTTKVSDVNLYVYTTDGDKRKLPAEYDGKLNCFVATSSFDMYSLPVNVSVDISTISTPLIDREFLTAAITERDSAYSDYVLQEEKAQATEMQINELLEQNELNFNSINTLFSQLGETTGNITSEEKRKIEEMSDEEWNEYIGESYESFDVDALLNGFNQNEGHFESDNENVSISYEGCEGIVESHLEDEGYLKIQTISGDFIYILSTEDYSRFVDFTNNLVITISKKSNDISSSRIKRANGMSDLQSKVYGISSAINNLVSMVANFQHTYNEKILRQREVVEKYLYRKLLWQTKIDGVPWWDASNLEQYLEYYKKYDNLSKQELEALEQLRRFEQISTYLGRIANGISILSTIFDGYKMIQDLQDWERVISSIDAPCEEAQSSASSLQREARGYSNQVMGAYGVVLAADLVGITTMIPTVSATLMTAGGALPLVLINIGTITASMLAEHYYIERSDNWKTLVYYKKNELYKLCKKKDDDDNNDDDTGTENEIPENDPSGFVYEAVPTNRIEGVKATVFYSEDEDGSYPTQWDAAEFGQINPQITDESGLYAWDVPQGFWKVIFEKDGYETTQTDWLPVPPPQLEINIPMSQAVAPYVEEAKGMESGITLSFSKYMKPNTLTKNSRVSVTCNGKKVGGDIELLNLEENPFNKEEYASKIKFVPNTAFTTSDEVIITVKKEVESYANKQMTEDFVQRVKIESEITEIACDSMMAVDYQGTGVLEIAVLPAAAAKGRTVQVASTSSMIASTDAQSVTLNDEGKARITISGELPGNASLHLSMPEAGKEKYVVVNVVTKEAEVVKMPKASKLSGSSFEDSYLLTLTCATKGATIYYTLDGSCPCDEQTRKKYTGPITLPEGQVTLQAIAVREGMTDSDIAEFTYTVTKDASGIKIIEESRDYECNYQDGSIIVTGAKGASCHIYDIQGRELGGRSRLGNQSRINVPKTDVYIVSVLFSNEQTVVHKIMAK